MQDYEIRKIKDCIYNVQDKLDALRLEVNSVQPYPSYCLEKLIQIKNDVNCLIAMFENKLIKEPSTSHQTENR